MDRFEWQDYTKKHAAMLKVIEKLGFRPFDEDEEKTRIGT